MNQNNINGLINHLLKAKDNAYELKESRISKDIKNIVNEKLDKIIDNINESISITKTYIGSLSK